MKRVLFTTLLAMSLLFVSCTKNKVVEGGETAEISISPTLLNISSLGGEYTIEVTANNSWMISDYDILDWVEFDVVEGSAGEAIPVKVTIHENPNSVARDGEFFFICKESQTSLIIQQDPYMDEPDFPEATTRNTYMINGVEYSFGSVAAFVVDENPAVVASPVAGLSSWEQIIAQDEFFYAAISPVLMEQQVDIMSESQLFTIMSQISGAIIETLAPDFLSEVTDGDFSFSQEDGSLAFKSNITLLDGTMLSVYIDAPQSVIYNDNTISRGDEVKPLRKAFYFEDSSNTYLYFTPAEIEYAEELSIASWFICIVADSELFTGNKFELGAQDGSFTIVYQDNLNEDNTWMISSSSLDGATGLLGLYNEFEGYYTVTLDMEYHGVSYGINFSGEVTSYLDTPPQPDNLFTYNTESYSVLSATIAPLEGVEEVSEIVLTLEGGGAVRVTLPDTFFDGNAHGFSQSEYLTVEYNGEVMSKANGYSGTLTASLNEQGELSIEFTNYDNCELFYIGIVE